MFAGKQVSLEINNEKTRHLTCFKSAERNAGQNPHNKIGKIPLKSL